MLPRNLISASLVLTAFVLSFFTNDKSIAEEKRKLNLEKDKVYEHVIKPILSANFDACFMNLRHNEDCFPNGGLPRT